ncbi:MAG: glycosyltransferase family 2 protein [Patescibacteria group bacterium]|nr:glycosyltransferase family 2 protein [Patescibacteria group bacterium]MDD5121425.1 glycosyltransferase family 2 protein [Patescibacteria group bacterium]MDD5221889.1 glycosyltransferase family 2 protein [Patescibacteria group bacterium]MDD5395656.1 glycosyltransferase family 2 protein [Patescibacteria group bacterium]
MLSIIIVNWNVRSLLERCLNSIWQNQPSMPYEVIIIDNNSRDGSQDFLESISKKFDNLKIIFNNQNLGFARACNQGFKKSKGEIILFLNPDTEILLNSLDIAIDHLKKDSSAGILGGQIIDEEKETQASVRSFPDVFSQALILLKLHNLFPRTKVFKKYFLSDFDYQKQQAVDQVMGACLLIKRELMEKLHGFDEKFFLWFEEVDLCYRAKKLNYQVVYDPEIKVKHLGHQSFFKISPLKKQKIYNRSLIYYFRKHHPFWQAIFLACLTPLSLLMSFFVQLFYPWLKNYYVSRRY